ncbi:hypothetical protein BRAS3809_1230001 [Bradyrhizobium sp. STM 3809]|nr:hypothetical protein BRAS3809_1230001 [Bradyrhizobium sp. STM 3809]
MWRAAYVASGASPMPQYVMPPDPYSALRGPFIPGKSSGEGTSATLRQWFCRTIFVSSQRVWQC